jgi:hypothetical protein
MQTYLKQPNDVLDYDVDMSGWFSSIPGDDIQSVALTVTSVSEEVPSLVLGPAPHPEYVLMGVIPVSFKIWIGGGTDYLDYVVTCVVMTEQDRRKEIEFKVKVRNR